MIPYLLAVAGGYILGNALKDPKFEDGGIAKGGKSRYEIVLKDSNGELINVGTTYAYNLMDATKQGRKVADVYKMSLEKVYRVDDLVDAEKNRKQGTRMMKRMDMFAEGGMMTKDYYIVSENGNPIFYNLSMEDAKRIVAENPSERTMMKQEDDDLRYRIITYDSREDYEMGNFQEWQSEEDFDYAVERAKHYQVKYKPFATEVYDTHKRLDVFKTHRYKYS